MGWKASGLTANYCFLGEGVPKSKFNFLCNPFIIFAKIQSNASDNKSSEICLFEN